MVTMVSNLLRLMLLTVPTLLGCSDDSQRSLQIKTEATNSQSTQIQQPNYYIDGNNIKYPYFSYETKDGESWAMFIHPMFEAKNRVLALSYKRGANLRELFGKEILGDNFLITKKNGFLENEIFLFFRPLDIKADWKWNTTYVKEDFKCKLVFQYLKDYKVQCISPSYTLNFIFNYERGVTSFQDFCYQNNICTYELKSGAGILSPYHLRSMGFSQNPGFE